MPARQTRSGRPAGDVGLVEQNLPRGRLQLAADLIDEAGLAGAVRADDDVAFARLNGEVDVVGDDEAAERAAQLIGAQQTHAQRLLVR